MVNERQLEQLVQQINAEFERLNSRIDQLEKKMDKPRVGRPPKEKAA